MIHNDSNLQEYFCVVVEEKVKLHVDKKNKDFFCTNFNDKCGCFVDGRDIFLIRQCKAFEKFGK